MPVWYATQSTLLRLVPVNEVTARLLAVTCGILTVPAVYVFGVRQRGLLFALALVLLLDGSQLLVWLSQQNRFYAMATLLLVLSMMAIRSKATGLGAMLLCAVCSLAAVLSHSLLVVVFGLGMVAACVCYPLGWISKPVFVKAVTAGVLAAGVFVAYIRPIAGGWTGVGLAWTHPFISFVGHVGVPTVALALFGSATCLTDPEQRKEMGWWAVLTAGSLAFIAVTPWVMPAWNARYALLFVLPLWITAAFAVEWIARRLPSPQTVFLWYGCVGLMLAPKLVSHYLDGTRHDLRAAAGIVAAEVRPDESILSNTTLRTKYYLPRELRGNVAYWEPTKELPPGECLVVYASNVWTPVARFPGRNAETLAQIGRRRFDGLSYVVRVYRVRRAAPATGPSRRPATPPKRELR